MAAVWDCGNPKGRPSTQARLSVDRPSAFVRDPKTEISLTLFSKKCDFIHKKDLFREPPQGKVRHLFSFLVSSR